MHIYMHKKNKDTCFEIVNKYDDGTAYVVFYNFNLHKISDKPLRSCECGHGIIKLKPMGEYLKWDGELKTLKKA